MRRFLSWLAALPSRAFVYLMESFVSVEDKPKKRRPKSVTRIRTIGVRLPSPGKSKLDLERIAAAEKRRQVRNAKRALHNYRPEAKKEIADVV